MGGEVDDRGDAAVADVALLGEAADDVFDAGKHARSEGLSDGRGRSSGTAGIVPEKPPEVK